MILEKANLTMKKAAAILNVQQGTIRRWVRENKFPKPIKCNGRILFLAHEVEAYIIEQNPHLKGKGDLKKSSEEAIRSGEPKQTKHLN